MVDDCFGRYWSRIGLGVCSNRICNLDPTIVAGLLLLSPITTVLVAPYTSGETISLLQAIGIIIVLAAVAYQNDLHTALLNKMRGVKQEVKE